MQREFRQERTPEFRHITTMLAEPWIKELWIYDFRTNQNFTLRTNPLKRYNLDNRFQHKETERFRKFSYEELTRPGKTNLDIF
jgi:type I restriction enzyme M protein